MVKLSRLIMIFDWRRQGLSISAIARKTGLCRKTIRQHLKRGLENPVYGPRHPRPRLLDPYEGYLRERVESCWRSCLPGSAPDPDYLTHTTKLN